jgi:bacteriorhodopsin
MNWSQHLVYALDTSFFLVFVSFAAGAFFLFLERDRVPEDYRAALRVSTVYLAIAAVNYFYMKDVYEPGNTWFPTSFRYVDWILTTPLMLVKFPLILGIGPQGVRFMTRLVLLDLVMIGTGFIGEVTPTIPAVHYGMFLIGCVAWLLILVSLVQALGDLPEHISDATRKAVRVMSMFLVIGWAVYPLGYLSPLLGLPFEARELVYNVGDLGNKLGLCLVIYAAAKRTAWERAQEEEAHEELAPALEPEAEGEPGAWMPDPAG